MRHAPAHQNEARPSTGQPSEIPLRLNTLPNSTIIVHIIASPSRVVSFSLFSPSSLSATQDQRQLDKLLLHWSGAVHRVLRRRKKIFVPKKKSRGSKKPRIQLQFREIPVAVVTKGRSLEDPHTGQTRKALSPPSQPKAPKHQKHQNERGNKKQAIPQTIPYGVTKRYHAPQVCTRRRKVDPYRSLASGLSKSTATTRHNACSSDTSPTLTQ